MIRTGERLGKEVRSLHRRLNVLQLNCTHLDALADDVMLDIDVFGARMGRGIGRERRTGCRRGEYLGRPTSIRARR